MEIENIGSGVSPQRKDSSQHTTKSLKIYQVRLREQRDKMRAQTQQSALHRQKSYGMAASPTQPTQNNSTTIFRKRENDAKIPLQQEKDTTVEKEREPSNSIPNEIRVLTQKEKKRRQRLSALDNLEMAERRKEEQEQERLVSERIRSSIASTKSRSVCQDLRCLGEDKSGDGEKMSCTSRSRFIITRTVFSSETMAGQLFCNQ